MRAHPPAPPPSAARAAGGHRRDRDASRAASRRARRAARNAGRDAHRVPGDRDPAAVRRRAARSARMRRSRRTMPRCSCPRMPPNMAPRANGRATSRRTPPGRALPARCTRWACPSAHSADDVRQRRTARAARARGRARQAHRDLPRRGRPRSCSRTRCARAAPRVDYIDCYRRARPESGAGGLAEALLAGRAHALTHHVERRPRQPVRAARRATRCACLRAMPDVRAASAHRGARARELGFSAVATESGDAGLIAGLLEWFASHPRP